VRDLHAQITEECSACCLKAISAMSKQRQEAVNLLFSTDYSDALCLIAGHYLRLPRQEVQMASAAIVAHCAKVGGEANLVRVT